MSMARIGALGAEYEAISRRDWDALFSAAHPDFELRLPDRSPSPRAHHGRERARRAFEDFFEPYDEVLVEPEQVFERGDRIVVFFVQRARPRGSRAVVELRAAHLWTMRDGRAAGLEIFPERERSLEAAGLA